MIIKIAENHSISVHLIRLQPVLTGFCGIGKLEIHLQNATVIRKLKLSIGLFNFNQHDD